MKNLLRSLSFIALSSVAFGQAQDKGVISFSVGYDAGIHGTIYTSQYQNNSPTTPDTSAAGTQLFRLNAQYNIFKFLSAGLDFRTGSYIEDPENATAAGNKVSMYGLSLRLYPVNKDKFVWYVGANFGGSRLTINRVYTFIISVPAQYKFKSSHTVQYRCWCAKKVVSERVSSYVLTTQGIYVDTFPPSNRWDDYLVRKTPL